MKEIGNTPASCGYLWDGNQWIRPFSGEVIKKEDKPEWDNHVECYEKGHDIESVENLVCLRCGADFNALANELK